MVRTFDRQAVLARCHGFQLVSGDELVGFVETPVFSGTSIEPDSLVVRTVRSIPGTFRTIAVADVEEVDPDRGLIRTARRLLEGLHEGGDGSG